jgi:hypothetical protein
MIVAERQERRTNWVHDREVTIREFSFFVA